MDTTLQRNEKMLDNDQTPSTLKIKKNVWKVETMHRHKIKFHECVQSTQRVKSKKIGLI